MGGMYVDIMAAAGAEFASIIPSFHTSDLTQPPRMTFSVSCLFTHPQMISPLSPKDIHTAYSYSYFSLLPNVTLRWLSFIRRALERCFIVNNGI